MIGICQEYFKVERWTIWIICAFYKKWSFFMKQYMGHTVLSINEVYQIYLKKKQRKNKITFVRKLLKILEMTTWFKSYFTHLIWIYLKFCQNRMYKWKNMHFYKNWSIFSKWTIWVKPYCPWLNFVSDFARYFGKCNAVWTRCAFHKIGQIFVKD